MRATILMAVAAAVMIMCGSVSAKDFTLKVNSDELIYGVVQRENPGQNPDAVGDKHMRNKAYGLLQIRAPYLKDVNRIVIERQNVAGYWVLKRMLLRAEATLPLPKVGRSFDFSMSFDQYAINTGLPDSIFARPALQPLSKGERP